MIKNLLPLFIAATFFTSCTSSTDDDYITNNTPRDTYSMIKHIAWEYGINDFQLDENYFEQHPNISEKEMETIFRLFTNMNGSFIANNVEKSTPAVLVKIKKANILDPSAESGTIEAHESEKIDTFEIRYSVALDFSWSSLGHSTVDLQKFDVERLVESPQYSGSYRWESVSSQTQAGVATFFGVGICFSYEFFVDIYLDGITMRKDVQCYYSGGMLSLNIQNN